MQTIRELLPLHFRRFPHSNELVQLSRSRRSFASSSLSPSAYRSAITRPLRRLCTVPRQRPIQPKNFQRRPNSTQQKPSSRPSPDPTAELGSPEPAVDSSSLSITQRFRKLSREYGWSAVGVYLLLSALDFPFCFAAVRLLGTERIGHWEHILVGYAYRLLTLDGRIAQTSQSDPHDEEKVGKELEGGTGMVAISKQGGEIIEQANEGQGWTWGVEEAEKATTKSDATIWTQLALAYAIHKSFIFVRVPLTAAITPKVVKVLRGWGWDIGKRRPKVPKGTDVPKSS